MVNRNSVETYLDLSLKCFETIFPVGDSANSGIELTIAELEKHSNCQQWVDVCKVTQADSLGQTVTLNCIQALLKPYSIIKGIHIIKV